MDYIVIENNGEIPVDGIRLLGHSEKDETKIGQFGSGLKQAIALLARLDALPIIFSGNNKIEFTVENDPQEIYFNGQPMNLSLNFGIHDWNDPWMAFREIMCNAIDEGGCLDGLSGNSPHGAEGKTRVWIPVNEQTLQGYNTIPDRLVMQNSEFNPLHEDTVLTVLPKTENSDIQIYKKGIWVQSGPNRSIFNYDIPSLPLNESRSSDWFSVRWQFYYNFERLPKNLLSSYLKSFAKKEDTWEYGLLNECEKYTTKKSAEVWREVAEEEYGENYVLMMREDSCKQEKLENAGYTIVDLSENFPLYSFLAKCECRTVSKVLSFEQFCFDSTSEPSPKVLEEFQKVWYAFMDMGVAYEVDTPKLTIFSATKDMEAVYKDGTCFISDTQLGNSALTKIYIGLIANHIVNNRDDLYSTESLLVNCVETLITL